MLQNAVCLAVILLLAAASLGFLLWSNQRTEDICARLREERDARIKRALTGTIVQIVLRSPDGRKVSFESMVIDALVRYGVQVVPMSTGDSAKVLSGDDFSSIKSVAIVGTWLQGEQGFGYKRPRYPLDRCDFRIIRSPGIIIAADFVTEPYEGELVLKILDKLATVFIPSEGDD